MYTLEHIIKERIEPLFESYKADANATDLLNSYTEFLKNDHTLVCYQQTAHVFTAAENLLAEINKKIDQWSPDYRHRFEEDLNSKFKERERLWISTQGENTPLPELKVPEIEDPYDCISDPQYDEKSYSKDEADTIVEEIVDIITSGNSKRINDKRNEFVAKYTRSKPKVEKVRFQEDNIISWIRQLLDLKATYCEILFFENQLFQVEHEIKELQKLEASQNNAPTTFQGRQSVKTHMGSENKRPNVLNNAAWWKAN